MGCRNLRWVDNFECLALNGVDEFVIDEQTCSVKISKLPEDGGARCPWGLTVADMIVRLGV